MISPVNLDSTPAVKAAIADSFVALRPFAVEGFFVLGPDPFAASAQRRVWLGYPAPALTIAQALARSEDFSLLWRD